MHADEPPQGQQRDFVFGLTHGKSNNFGPETQGESEHSDPAHLATKKWPSSWKKTKTPKRMMPAMAVCMVPSFVRCCPIRIDAPGGENVRFLGLSLYLSYIWRKSQFRNPPQGGVLPQDPQETRQLTQGLDVVRDLAAQLRKVLVARCQSSPPEFIQRLENELYSKVSRYCERYSAL